MTLLLCLQSHKVINKLLSYSTVSEIVVLLRVHVLAAAVHERLVDSDNTLGSVLYVSGDAVAG